MSKVTIIIVLIVQVITKPVLEDSHDWLRELMTFSIAVILGTGFRVAMKLRADKTITILSALLILVFGVVLGGIANYLMIFYNLNLPRPVIVCGVSLFGEFFAIWIEKKHGKIISKLFKKGTGIDVEDDKDDKD